MKIRQICMLVLLCLGVIPAVQASNLRQIMETSGAGRKEEPA